jgi:hypothetical protein
MWQQVSHFSSQRFGDGACAKNLSRFDLQSHCLSVAFAGRNYIAKAHGFESLIVRFRQNDSDQFGALTIL